MLTKTEIMQKLSEGKNCAMVTFGEFAEELGYDTDETDAIGAVFGGGMEHGSVCGAVTGAYMTLGAFAQNKEKAIALAAEFDKKFKERFGTIYCRELLGYDFEDPEQKQKARESGVMGEKCPACIGAAIEILEELTAEE